MRLVDLHPQWFGAGENNSLSKSTGIGVDFDCPCGCDSRVSIPFLPTLDGLPQPYGDKAWAREGDTFENLTLKPSILRVGGCPKKWHGFVTAGLIQTC